MSGETPSTDRPTSAARLAQRIADREARAGVIGLGYVGLPLAAAAARAGFSVIGFDIDETKPPRLNAGRSYIDAVTDADLARLIAEGRFEATADMSRLAECDVLVICVPTPLTQQREPDLSFIEQTVATIAVTLRPGQLVVLESTTYPGTTDDLVRPRLERTGLASGRDFFLGFSPEREDPGNQRFTTATIPKVVAGDGIEAGRLMEAFYGAIVDRVVPVSSLAVAEAVKITENVFRSVNVALVNELKVIYAAMGIDVWEVIAAAETKPFGYMPFYPGPGLGGHCIPIDPFYLAWKAREFGVPTRFIELAGEINTAMPRYVAQRLEEALDRHQGVALGRSRILLIGLAYKKNVSDVRESPALRLMELLEARGATCDFHDPHVAVVPPTREHPRLAGRRSTGIDAATLSAYDGVLIATDHDAVDYGLVARHARLVVDSRNAMARRGHAGASIVKA